MELLKKIANHEYNIFAVPKVYCKAIEDNSGKLEIACLPKMYPHTKEVNMAYHHFHEHVHLGKISIYPIATNSQLADVFTEPLTKTHLSTFGNKFVDSN